MTTLILEPLNYSEVAIREYQKLGDVWLGEAPSGQIEQVKVVVVRLGQKLNKEYIDAYPSLCAIVTPTTGLTHIELPACETRGIRIFSLANCRDDIDRITSTSELTLGMIICLLRRIPMAHMGVVSQGLWDRDLYRSRQLSNLSLGIIGLGRIGGHIATYANVLGMQVLAYDPFQSDQRFDELLARRMKLDELLKSADIVSIHANLTDDNYHLIGSREINLLQPHALIINTARGALLDENAAAKALQQNRLGGIAVDVLADEHSVNSHLHSPLVQAAKAGMNVIVTPHIGGCTSDAMHITEERMAEFSVLELGGKI
jgi:D-3-phosphoglycerate dehydrogenase / 2-oxoglutarate reductase